MKLNQSSRFVFFAACGILCASIATAQNFVGGVRGLVQDPGGAVIVGATVTLTNDATGVARTATSNATGQYSFSQADPATYSITAEAQGFKKLTRPGVIIGTQEFLTIDLKMELGQMTESVQVTTEVPLVENTNASNGQVLNEQQVADLPNLGRNVYLLSKLSTNVVPGGDPRWNRFQDQIGSSQISIGGGPIRGNNYFIDGIPVTDAVNRAVVIPTVEGVQEMKLQMGTYDATMGRTGGGVFNTVLKTGTNDFHGDVFGYYRTTDLTANTFFANTAGQPRSATLFKNFGGGMGGPVYIPKIYNGKNKTFFYVAQEAYRQHTPVTIQYEVPTALEKTGNFSQSNVTIYNPSTTRPCTSADNCPSGVSQVRTPFAGNAIPPDQINPIGRNIINVLPNPTNPSAGTDTLNYTGNDSLFDRADEYIYKVEHSVTNWFRLTGSFVYYKSREPGGNALGIPEGSGSYLLFRHVDATAINAIFTPNPTTVVTLRYGFNRFPNVQYGVAFNNPSAPNLNKLGFPSNYISGVGANYFPNIGLLGQSLSSTSLSYSNYYSKNAMASVSKYIGRHSLTYGFDYRVINSGPSVSYNSGTFSFNGVFSRKFPTQSSTTTGADFADLLMGYPDAGSANTAVPLNVYVRYYGGYIQDDIRVNNKLTVNVGLRYEYETGESEVNNDLVTNFNETAINPIAAGLPPGSGVIPYGVIGYAGINGNPTSCCRPSRTKFGPRVGTAYQLNSKTTFRAGIGIFYAPTVFSSSDSAPGYTQANGYVASNNGNATPANSLSNPFPQGVAQPPGNSLGALTAIGNSLSFLDPNKAGGGIVYQYSTDIQREIGKGIAAEMGYIGSRSNGLTPSPTGTGTLPINQIAPANVALGQSYLNTSVANPFYGLPGAAGVIANPTVNRAQLLLPFPEYTTISENTTVSHARYDSLVAKVQKRFSHGLTFLSTITWSRNEDNEWSAGSGNALNGLGGASGGGIQNIYNINAEWARSGLDTPLRWTGSWTYQLPFGHGKPFLNNNRILDYTVGGWSVNGTAVINTGFPLFIVQSNQNGNLFGGSTSSPISQRPNATGVSPARSGSPESLINGYINPAAFTLAPADTFGNISRDIPYRSPGQANWDVSLFKDFKFKERFTAQFRAEALNAFNTPLFAPPPTTLGLKTFGVLNYQANIPRELQLGVRFAW